jgi:HK97 family phage prohead protease
MLQTRTASPKPTIEYRTFDVRALDPESDGFDGHASTFWAVDSYATAMAPGAFKRTLKNKGDKRLVLWQHDPSTPIGKTTALKEDKEGLAFSAAVSMNTRAGSEAMALLRDEVPLGMSFGFQTVKDRSAEDTDPLDFTQRSNLKAADVRVITEVNLWEVSLVTFPANEAATISAVRSDMELDALTTLLDAIKEDDLDETRTALVAQIIDAWSQRPGPAAIEPHSTPGPSMGTPARRRYAEYNALLFKCDLVQEMIR